MRPSTRTLLAALAVVTLVGCGSSGDGPEAGDDGTGTVTVFAAASLTDVISSLGATFEAAHPGTSVAFSFGPSSGLATQVREGAPADVVATASTDTMDDLAAAGVLDGAPRPFATNGLEIAVPPGNPGGVEGLADLADADLVVALCAAEVPCGRFAREAFAAAGVVPSVDSDEQDVRALLTKVEAGEVDAGVVYRTDVVAAGDAVEGIALPAEQDVTATYPIAVTDEAGDGATAQAFVDLVLSPTGQAALADAGFGPP